MANKITFTTEDNQTKATFDYDNLQDVQVDAIKKVLGITPSGTINITENGDHDVTNYATANVEVEGGGTSTTPFCIVKSTWGNSTVTITLGSWSHTFNITGSYSNFSVITYEDLIANGWDGGYILSVTFDVSYSNTTSPSIDFFGFMSSAGPTANIDTASVTTAVLSKTITTGADPMSSANHNCFAVITCGNTKFVFD